NDPFAAYLRREREQSSAPRGHTLRPLPCHSYRDLLGHFFHLIQIGRDAARLEELRRFLVRLEAWEPGRIGLGMRLRIDDLGYHFLRLAPADYKAGDTGCETCGCADCPAHSRP